MTMGLACLACVAHADVFRPAYLELRETGGERYDVMWKVPAQGDARLAVEVVFPPGTVTVSPTRGAYGADAYVERWSVHRPGGLAGQTVAIEGIAGGVTDVIVRVERSDGSSQVEHLLPHRPQFTLLGISGSLQAARSYLVFGIEHIMGGVDHLLFVLSLLLIVRGGRNIFATITAFTLAHSLTLAAATLGWMRVAGPPVEAMIALSIVFVAAEAVRGLRGRPGLTARAPWLVAFSFGLLHGFGFASALAEVGLPRTAIPLALVSFNIGIELGQLAIVAVVLGLLALQAQSRPSLPGWAASIPPYAIGTVAMCWVFVRLGAF